MSRATSIRARSTRDQPTRKGRRSKPAIERWAGDVPSDDGVWGDRRRLVDREGDWYEETVFNADGTVRHHQAEPLSEYFGHGFGSASRPMTPALEAACVAVHAALVSLLSVIVGSDEDMRAALATRTGAGVALGIPRRDPS